MTLVLEDVAIRYGERAVLDDVNAALPAGRIVALVGPNGSGKSSLLRGIAGVVPGMTGAVTWNGVSLAGAPRRTTARTIAIATQRIDAPGRQRTRDVVMTGRAPHLGIWGVPRKLDHAAVTEAIDRFDLAAEADRWMHTLSSGQRQRAWLASSYVQDTPVLLLDEPFSAQDPSAVTRIAAALRARAADGGLVVVALHDLTLAMRLADRVVFLHEQRVAYDGAPDDPAFRAFLADAYGEALRWTETELGPVILPSIPRIPTP